MPEALLIEIEGVIADTQLMRRDALRDSLADEGILLGDALLAAASAARTPRAAAAHAARAAEVALDAVALDLVALRAERAFERRVSAGVTLRPGAAEFMSEAAGRTRLAIVTRATHRVADLVLALADISHSVEFVVAAEDVLDAKPASDGYRIALERLARRRSVAPHRVVALEDGLDGIRAARGAGLRAVAVGHFPAHEAMEGDALLAAVEGLSVADLDAMLRAGEGIA